jgi:hypothetical protein
MKLLLVADKSKFFRASRGGFVEHLGPTYVAQQSVTKIIYVKNIDKYAFGHT